MVFCKKCKQKVDEVYACDLCSGCILYGFDEAVKENPEYYKGDEIK